MRIINDRREDQPSDINRAKRPAETISKKTRRIILLVLFVFTVSIPAGLYVRLRLSSWWQKIKNPSVYKIDKTKSVSDNTTDGEEFIAVPKDNKEAVMALDQLVKDLHGTYGIYFISLVSANALGYHEQFVFTSASVNKLPIIVNFYKAVEAGKLAEENEYILQRADIQDYGTGKLRYERAGTKYGYGQLVTFTGKYSDNTAAYILEKAVGRDKIQLNLDSLGMKNTSIVDNTTTPKEMGDYFVLLYKNKLVSQKNRDKIFNSLTETDFEDRIPKGVPDNVQVAHKIGNEIQTYNDCGIVFSSKPYVLCILSKEVSEEEAFEIIPKISKLLYLFANKNGG